MQNSGHEATPFAEFDMIFEKHLENYRANGRLGVHDVGVSQKAHIALVHLLGEEAEADATRCKSIIVARLQKVFGEQADGDIVRRVDQFSEASTTEQAFRLLRFAIHLASNDMLSVESATLLLQWILEGDNFSLVAILVASRIQTTRAFAGVLLIAAVSLGESGVCQTLLKHGADPNCTAHSIDGRYSPLSKAVEAQDSALVHLLLDNGAEVSGGIRFTQLLLEQALMRHSNSRETKCKEIIQLLINKDADMLQRVSTQPQLTLVHLPILHENLDVLEIFLQTRVNVNFSSTQHPTALQTAAVTGNVAVVEKLLLAGADVDGRMSTESADARMGFQRGLHIYAFFTPLQIALFLNHGAAAESLLQGGADVNGFDARAYPWSQVYLERSFNLDFDDFVIRNRVRNIEYFHDLRFSEVNTRCRHLREQLWVCSSPLQMAALHKNILMGSRLLEKGASVDTFGGFGTALQVACAVPGNRSFIQLLLDNGADLNAPAQEPRGRTALQAALELGEDDTVQILIQRGANINAASSSWAFTALQAAALAKNTGLLLQLIQKGAEINAPAAANEGRTALQAAVEAQDERAVDLLLQNGADITAPPAALKGGLFALAAAVHDELLLGKLLKRGDELGMLPELRKENKTVFSALDYHNPKALALVFTYGMMAGQRDKQCWLQIYIQAENLEMVRRLMTAGADVNIPCSCPNSQSASPIAIAAGTKSLPICGLLVKSNARLGGCEGTEALYSAISNECSEILDFLLSQGVDPNCIKHTGGEEEYLSPLARCFQTGHYNGKTQRETMAGSLLRYGAMVKGVAFPPQVCDASRAMLERLIQLGLDVNRRLSAKHSTMLQYVVSTKLMDFARVTEKYRLLVVKLLIEAGADINSPAPTDGGNTALQAAVEMKRLYLVKHLLSLGVKVNGLPSPNGGATALQRAVGINDLGLVEHLLSLGADVNGPPSPKNGATALQRAVIKGWPSIFRLLIDKGADVNAPAAQTGGRTALDFAAKYGRLDMAHVLLQKDKDAGTLPLRCQEAAVLAAAEGFPVLAEKLRQWTVSDS